MTARPESSNGRARLRAAGAPIHIPSRSPERIRAELADTADAIAVLVERSRSLRAELANAEQWGSWLARGGQ